MRLFVTGGSGFLGQHLLPLLAGAGHQVSALTRQDRALPGGAAPVRGDLREVNGFKPALRGVEAVIHSAALLDPIRDEREGRLVNVEGTLALATAAAEAGVQALVFVSTIAVLDFRHSHGMVAEDAATAPSSLYGRTKVEAERRLLELPGPMRVCILRPPTVYGRGEAKNFLALTRAVATGAFPIVGGGANRMSFCDARNLAQALLLAATSPGWRGLFHVADAVPVTQRQAVETIARALGKRPLPLPLPLPAARLLARACDAASAALGGRRLPFGSDRLRTLTADFALDPSRALSLGYRPPVAFEEGVREAVAWYREAGLLRA